MNNPSVEEDDQSWNKYNVPHTTGKKVCMWMGSSDIVRQDRVDISEMPVPGRHFGDAL